MLPYRADEERCHVVLCIGSDTATDHAAQNIQSYNSAVVVADFFVKAWLRYRIGNLATGDFSQNALRHPS
jgi:hypothetical protein